MIRYSSWLITRVKYNHMHELVHLMRNESDAPTIFIKGGPLKIRVEAYLDFWLAGLFVVVEGFGKLELARQGNKKTYQF